MPGTFGVSRAAESFAVSTRDSRPGETIVFSPFCLDLRAGQLLRGAEPVPLRPRTFAVLRHLVERPGALVTKRELLDVVWADAAVTENTLTQSIRELRRALQDDTTPPRFVETVHHRGFRFVAAVTDRMPSTTEEPPATTAPFVGRAAELQRLDELLDRAQRGQRQLLFVTGEAGIGKTTLLQSFLASPAASRVLVARGQVIEQMEAREPYLPVLDALGRLARIADPKRVVPLLRRVAPAWLAQMPWLMEPADAVALRQSLLDVRPERMLRELAVFLEEFTATATLILVLEDLHWSDPSTVELLVMLAQRSELARLLVIGTYRPAEASVHEHPLLRAKHTLQLRRRCTEIALEYLTRAEVQAYLDGRFPGAGFPGALADLIHAQTDGNPLFVGAVIDQLVTRGWLLDTEPGWSLAVPLETLRLEVPDDLREMIRFQFQAMGPLDRSLLEAASVIADAFTADDVAQTIAAELLAVESSCEQLVRTHRFLRIVDDAAMPDGTARHYAFRHALYKHVVYEEIPAAKRRGLHLRVGEALESAHADGSARNTFRLAAHFERGGDPVRAIAYSAAAAAEAQRRFAPREAISCLEAALALTPQLHDEKEARHREIELRVALTAALNLVHGYASEEVRESCERTRTLCEQTASLPELYEALYALWYSQAMRAERDTTRETTKQLAEVAERLGGPEPRLRAATTRGQIALYEGRFQEASDTLTEAIDRWEARSGTAEGGTYGPDPVMAANANLALALWFLGYPESARSTHRKTLSMAQQSGLPFDLAAALVHISFVELLCGNGSEALRSADRGLALATEHGFPMWQTFATGFRGWARMDLGEPAAGVEDVRAAIAGLESGGVKLMKPVLLAGLAGSGLRLGIPSEGLAAVDEGLRLMPTILDRFYEPELWRLKGELLLSRPADRKTARSPSRDRLRREAEECFRTALKIAQERGSRSLELRAAMSLARLEKMLGERGSAYDLLAAVHGWFTEGFDTGDLIQAKDLLEAPGHGSRTVRSRGARTTSRL